MKTTIYNQKGEKVDEVVLPKAVFDLPWNDDLVHQVVVSLQSNKRHTIAHTKGRGEVSGSGKKPWRQKGTGRARHGSKRSPIWIGGGVTHGPTNEKDYTKKINKKVKQKAFLITLSQKLRDNEIIFLDTIKLDNSKTKEAHNVLKSISKIKGFESVITKRKNKAVLAVPKKDESMNRGFRNIAGMKVSGANNLGLLDILTYKYLIISDPKEFIAGFK